MTLLYFPCRECGVPHAPEDPHNPETPRYIFMFYLKNGRQPTWEDAYAHCSLAVKESCKASLKRILKNTQDLSKN